ncbi:MAG TPA: GNAT family N-acetyltransferase [Thermoanaerobaculia bacterium]|jgi:N-acetylglutamate synthase-like GNAT family acetyltransferase|nr:GNAT family N-acetyltransferase [Thermoanaerobaculia bacterium]
MADPDVLIRPLREMPEAGRLLAGAFKDAWPDFFADRQVEEIEEAMFVASPRDSELPAILVASQDGRVAGTVALRARSVETHEHLGPWVTGLWVTPDLRGLGLGRDLMHAIAAEAAARGFREIYAVTNTARGLFEKLGWAALEDILYHGEEVTLYRGGMNG